MGGHSKKAGKGGGGANGSGRNCLPEDRKKLNRDPGVPGTDLRRLGQSLMRTKEGGKRHVLNIPTLDHRASGAGAVDVPCSSDGQRRQRVSEMAAFALQCSKRQAEYDAPTALLARSGDDADGADGTTNDDEATRRGKDQSLRRFYKEFQNVVESSDVLLEVLDVRDPMGCRLSLMEKSIASQWGDRKTIVVVLNKVDLVEPSVLDSWIRWFEEDQNMIVAPFSASKDCAQRNTYISKLFRLLRSIARKESGARKSITVGLIGYPNVGKSSVINALKRRNVVGVGNMPGFTTGNTEVDLRQDIKIIDCPGVVMPGEDTGDVVLRNAVKVDRLPNPLVVVERLIQRCSAEQLSAYYDVGTFHDTVEFVRLVGMRRGRVRQGGFVDEDETARIILHDWNDGKIGYYTLPPTTTFTFGKSSVIPSNEPTSSSGGEPQLLTALSAGGINVDGALPTFHLRNVEPSGSRKRHAATAATARQREQDDGSSGEEAWSDDASSDCTLGNEDEDEPPRKSRKR